MNEFGPPERINEIRNVIEESGDKKIEPSGVLGHVFGILHPVLPVCLSCVVVLKIVAVGNSYLEKRQQREYQGDRIGQYPENLFSFTHVAELLE